MLKQEFSDGLQISMNTKDITIPLIIHYYLFRYLEHYTNLSTLNHNVRFSVSAPGRWHNATRVRAKPRVHRFNYSDTPAEKFPVRAVDIVNPGIQMTIHRTRHTLININNMKFQLIV